LSFVSAILFVFILSSFLHKRLQNYKEFMNYALGQYLFFQKMLFYLCFFWFSCMKAVILRFQNSMRDDT